MDRYGGLADFLFLFPSCFLFRCSVCLVQVIVFLYLLDNDTSWMILLSSGVGVLIEFWKITKVAKVSLDRSRPLLRMVRVEDKEGYAQSPTAQYDREAMRYLSFALCPIVVGCALYSLYYNEHKSWYSWLLGSLTLAVYSFGFIMMCPQLFLNYKLKSVAHLPWRMLTYKALNTFIDDLFAFIIKMPTLHRLSCFRDDVVFFVYLYQRWIYRIDYTRANEFGLRVKAEGTDREESQEKAAQVVAAPSLPDSGSAGRSMGSASSAVPASAPSSSSSSPSACDAGPAVVEDSSRGLPSLPSLAADSEVRKRAPRRITECQ